jgi:UDP-2,3-diacylglucosamine pyrophosphatase LpxH
MNKTFFSDMINNRLNPVVTLDISQGGKALVISDLHMGGGRRDDLAQNGALLLRMLESYYLKGGWNIVLNGDIEELQRFSRESIRKQWSALYEIFDAFHAQGRLYKTLGNHDEDLVFEKKYPYPLCEAVLVKTGHLPVYVYHGHQFSALYTKYNTIVRMALRYLLRPLGVRNISSGRSPYRRFYVEKQAYDFSLEHNCISIIGHTHRALFESLGRFEYIKFEIERLCRDYPEAQGEERERIAKEALALRRDLGKLKRSERRNAIRQSLYGDDLPVPCLFNSGSAIGRKGINAIEIDNEKIALVYWFVQGEGRKFVSRGRYPVSMLPGTRYCRTVLNQDKLSYIEARVELLGNSAEINPDSLLVRQTYS